MKGHLLKALVLLLTLTSTVLGQYSFDFSGGGARAEAMGEAYLALSDDVYSASWNPAGLYAIEKPVLGFSWTRLSPRGGSSVILPISGTWMDHTGSFSNLGSIAFAAPFRVKGHPFVGSAAFSRSWDVFLEFSSTYDQLNLWQTQGGLLWLPETMDYRFYLEGGMDVFNMAIATRLYNNISFGISANICTGSVLRQQFVDRITEYYPITLQIATAQVNSIIEDTSKFSGVNFTLGFKYSGEKTWAGLIVKTPFTLKTDYDSVIYQVAYINGGVVDDGTDTVYFMDKLVKYEMPWIIGFGFAYQVTERLLLAADAEYRAFAGGKVLARESILINPGGDNIETFVEYDPDWQNVSTIRLGGEYMLDTRAGQVPLRLGAGYCPMPDRNSFATGEISDANRYCLSLGTGIHWSQIRLDLTYSLSTMDYHAFDGYAQRDFTYRNYRLNLGFTGVF
ncbi:MAG: outer membrane protein transport protein [Candidatus Zixiibacteriota bacterium]|nr:MAG: outer membrane protein transport protein [candidate division Zixibacteria bacterium]